MTKHLLIIILSFSFAICNAQDKISGKLIDAKTKAPILYGTIYIDGTTNGTISSTTGKFNISVKTFPCQIIFSHVGYEREVLQLKNHAELGEIYLKPLIKNIDEVRVQSTNKRKKNLKIFRKELLGTDKWGKNAKILNEDKIFFSREEIKPSNSAHTESILVATSQEPLKIDIPLLGYTLHFDLVRFEAKSNYTSHLGFYYFQPIENLNSRGKQKIEKNRKEVFYNSSHHFIRSIYNGNSEVQGYGTSLIKWEKQKHFPVFEKISLNSFLIKTDNSNYFKGVDGKTFQIFYYSNNKGDCIDLSKKENWPTYPQTSTITFLADSCSIRSNGTLPDNSIQFGGIIGSKQVGAALPADYFPPK